MDDSFAKFDSKAAFRLFYSVFKNCLNKKTVVYTSRTDKYLQFCDQFGFIKNGSIIEQGTSKNAESKMESLRQSIGGHSVTKASFNRDSIGSVNDQSVVDIYNRLRDKNARNINTEKETLKKLESSTKEFCGEMPPKFGSFFVEHKSASFKILLAVVLYLVASCAQLGSVIFLHYVGWHDLHQGVFKIKGKLIKCIFSVTLMILAYLMYCFSAHILNFSLGNEMFNYFSDLMIKRLLTADVYTVM